MLRVAALAALLLGWPLAAQASYRDGFAGLVVLAVALPVAVLLVLVGLLLRAAGVFARPAARRAALAVAIVPAALPMVWILPSGDAASLAMLWIGLPLLAALATAPAWVRVAPNRGPPPPSDRWRRALAGWWIVGGLWGATQLARALATGLLPLHDGFVLPGLGLGLAGDAAALLAGALAWRPRPGALAALGLALALRTAGLVPLTTAGGLWSPTLGPVLGLWAVDLGTALALAWRLMRASGYREA